jgi:hypothetical protein
MTKRRAVVPRGCLCMNGLLSSGPIGVASLGPLGEDLCVVGEDRHSVQTCWRSQAAVGSARIGA